PPHSPLPSFPTRRSSDLIMRIAILSAGAGWHVRDLQRAARLLGHEAAAVDFRRLHAGVAIDADPLAAYDGVLVRTMPPGSLDQRSEEHTSELQSLPHLLC